MRIRLMAAALFLLGSACASLQPGGDTVPLRLLAFNDFHGNIQAKDPSPGRVPVSKADGTIEQVDAGGAAYLAALVNEQRVGQENSLLISAGDLTGASPMLSGLLKDEPTIGIMNGLGLDMNVVGNHEFDSGRQELLRKKMGDCAFAVGCLEGQFKGAQFHYLAANVIDAASGKPLFPPYVVKKVGGIEVAFIGVVTKETPHIVSASGVAGLRFLDEADTLNQYAAELKQRGIRAIVAVIHEGATAAPDTPTDGGDCKGLTGALIDIVHRSDPAIDLFISGHTHQTYACRLDGRMVTQAGNYGRYLTVIDASLKRGDGDLVVASARILPVLRDLAPDAEVLTEIKKADDETAPLRRKEVATLAAALSRKPNGAGESALGDVIADAQLAAAEGLGAVIALTNPGGIRQDLPSDPEKGLTVNLGDLFAVQPFNNNLVAMDVTGRDLKLLLEQQWLGQPEDRKPRILQISAGFSYCYDARRAEGDRILTETMRLDGRPIDLDASYRIAVNNFLASGGDRFLALKNGHNTVQGGNDLEALRDFLIRYGGEVASAPANRICSRS